MVLYALDSRILLIFELRKIYSLIVFITDLKCFFDDDQRIGKLSLILAVENGSGNFRSQISRLESPILKTYINRINQNINRYCTYVL